MLIPGLQNPELSNKKLNLLLYQFHIWQVAFEFCEWNYERQARNIGARLVTSIEEEYLVKVHHGEFVPLHIVHLLPV